MNVANIAIVTNIRRVFDEHVSHESDDNLLRAYACWHVLGGQDWNKFLPLCDKLIREHSWEHGYLTSPTLR